MARKPVPSRRQEIIDTTLEVIRQQGLPAARTANLAAALDISSALIFYHFGTLEKLVAEAFEYAAGLDLERLDEVRRADGTVTDRLRAVLRLYGPTGDAEGWKLWIEGWAAALHDPAIRELTQQFDLRWREAVADLIAEGVAAGEFQSADPSGAAWRVTALLDGLAVQLVVRRDTVTQEQVTAWVEQALAHELGIGAASSGG
jgi:AcrR family transcriptional regulator